jgi:hypothetical protein
VTVRPPARRRASSEPPWGWAPRPARTRPRAAPAHPTVQMESKRGEFGPSETLLGEYRVPKPA